MKRLLLAVAGLVGLLVIGGIGYMGFSPAEMTMHSVHKDIPASRFVKQAPPARGGVAATGLPLSAGTMPNQGVALPSAAAPASQPGPAH